MDRLTFGLNVQITMEAICKMLMSLESNNGDELEILQNDVSLVCEAMLAFPLSLPFTRFYKGLQVYIYITIVCD